MTWKPKMPRPASKAELRDYAEILIGKHRAGARAKADERMATLTKLTRPGLIIDWLAIGEEIASLLRT